MNVSEMMEAYSALVQALTAAVAQASKAGLSPDEIKQALEWVAGLVENAEEE
jgi:hypothetical protein